MHLNQQNGNPSQGAPLFLVEGLKKVYRSGTQDLLLFENLSFQVGPGEMLGIVGESGSGKSSLLHILGALDRPTAGQVVFEGLPLQMLNEQEAARFRGTKIGFVWQFHYLLPEFSALENVAMPLLLQGVAQSTAREKAQYWLGEVELEERATHRPGELSGGEQQRIALARALITGPKILMADEPTGDLDQRTSEFVFDLIARLHREHRLTSLIVTHNLDFARRCSRVLKMRAGEVTEVAPASL